MLLHRRTLLRAAAAVGLIAATSHIPIMAQPKPRIIPMRAKKFSYEPSEVTLKLNEPVTFQLTSADVVMGFSVPDFKARGTIIPGQMIEVSMTPDKVGEFTFLCDVFCGSGHENMEGTIRVVT
jgi:cytochrome c oxidase subunit II